jgi:hypothetical protein
VLDTASYGIPFNPAKVLTSMGNTANSGRLFAVANLKMAGALAAGATGNDIGAAAMGGWAIFNLQSAAVAKVRGAALWSEAMNETAADASWKNLAGMLPAGTHYDDPTEPNAAQYWGDRIRSIDSLSDVGA